MLQSATTTVPNVVFKTRVRDERVEGPNPFRWQDVGTDEIFRGRKVIVLALPGAFTPTCSSTHLPGYEAEVPVAEPAQPLRSEGVRAVAIDGQRRYRPRVVRQDLAAVPARPPPAVHCARRDGDIAELERNEAAVRPHILAVGRIVDARHVEIDGQVVAEPGIAGREFRLLARRVGKAPDPRRFLREGQAALDPVPAALRLALSTRQEPVTRTFDRDRHDQLLVLRAPQIGFYGVPRERPGGDRPADHPVVGEQLDLVAQADVAGGDNRPCHGRTGQPEADDREAAEKGSD